VSPCQCRKAALLEGACSSRRGWEPAAAWSVGRRSTRRALLLGACSGHSVGRRALGGERREAATRREPAAGAAPWCRKAGSLQALEPVAQEVVDLEDGAGVGTSPSRFVS